MKKGAFANSGHTLSVCVVKPNSGARSPSRSPILAPAERLPGAGFQGQRIEIILALEETL